MPCAQRGAFALQTQPTRTERIIVTNRKALHEYEILQRFQAGIQLTGTEVKSIRAGKISLAEAYATFPSRTSDELLLLGMHINPYDFGNRENHEPMRPRKLLLHRHELHRLRIATEEKGLTIIPLSVFFSGPFIKVELGVARGKKLYDKRESIKERDEKRRMNRDERD
ncbi:MAG: SsrA-binding protein SmpB [Chlorobi bacterium]|nr:MAG: SsrA-binding protein SmpB [Bacteroidota bacterium]KXK35081.1 MAG: tmRNA-binding protein [Chlorobi bacterium OLB6]MBE2265567.1 SsrA-binding protein SmpB [Flavobacteriales bacterium]MBL1161733.1 SsrA-binding protein SmpB [Chlorobiota bacterium]MBW7853905.1 SsrA-binding protein SmpB [Candidatus Kapabacteria bacterium]MCC6331782.1 SsrA-binding protein SmpB [Ignavibacteria bacterium]